MDHDFPIAVLRRELGMTLEQFSAKIGLASKGNMSIIERGGSCSVKVALAIEALSGGRIPAASINTDVALVDQARLSRNRQPAAPPPFPNPPRGTDLPAPQAADTLTPSSTSKDASAASLRNCGARSRTTGDVAQPEGIAA